MNVGRYLRGEDRHVGTARVTKPKVAEMNRRIKELAGQAEEYAYIHDGIRIPILNTEKFAELIVRECAHLVGGYTKENEFGTDVKEAYEEITKHFGVEE